MAPPRGQFGNRLDTEAGRAKEAQMAAAAAAAQRGDPNANAMAAAIPNAPQAFVQAVASTASQSSALPPGTDTTRLDPYEAGRAAVAAGANTVVAEDQENIRARQEASARLNEVLATWGLSGLGGVINDLLIEFGPNAPTAIMSRIKDTQQYKDRFKGLLALRQRGITDITDEGMYLRLERDYRQVFREAGLRDYLGQAGTQAEFDAIAKIVGDFSLSVDEVRERVTDAQRVVAETPQEVRDSLQRFYGIDPNLLTQYVLDPTRTSTEIQRRANAAIVGGYAQRAGLEFGAGVSERIGEFLGGERDIQGTQIEPQLTQIADIQRSTQRLAEIEQGELSAETSALAALDLDREARERVRTLQSRERARFGGRAGITTGSLSSGPSI